MISHPSVLSGMAVFLSLCRISILSFLHKKTHGILLTLNKNPVCGTACRHKERAQQKCRAHALLLVCFVSCKQNKSAQQQKSHLLHQPFCVFNYTFDLFSYNNGQTHTSRFLLLVIITYGVLISQPLAYKWTPAFTPFPSLQKDSYTPVASFSQSS